jgi:poly(3-hydroxyalkanoate) synthetase
MQNLDKIKSKYNAVWMFCLSEQIRAMQTKACKERDEQNSYDPEIELNEKIGKHVNKLLDITGLTNIHLLGKCAGGGVLLHTFVQDDEKYNALYF